MHRTGARWRFRVLLRNPDGFPACPSVLLLFDLSLPFFGIPFLTAAAPTARLASSSPQNAPSLSYVLQCPMPTSWSVLSSICVSPLAQALYEAGYITYMRTDRPTLSKEAAGVAERAVRDSFGDEYVRKGERATYCSTAVDARSHSVCLICMFAA